MPPTALELIEAARLKHWSFTDTALGDGAAVRFINSRLRTLMLRYRESVRSLANVTIEQATVINGVLVGVDGDGVPYFATTSEDGYAVHLDAVDGTPYIDLTDTVIARDPFGESGGTPGWPLPADAIALFSLSAVYADGSAGQVDVVEEATRHHGAPSHSLSAFLTGSRVVPIRASGKRPADAWSTVMGVQLNYLPLPTIATLTDVVALPAVFTEALEAAIAELFANQSKDCPAKDQARFTAAARRAEQELDAMALDIVGDLQVSSVIYEG